MIKTFEAVFDKNNRGVYSISLVEDPAMEGDFVALSKNRKIEFKTVDEEQRILLGLVLEPNKPIYRNQDGEEFNIVFSEQTIKDLSHNFFKQGYQTNSSIEHENDVTGVSFVESWIVEDSKIDKSANFGFSYPKGSWIATMKVDDDTVWNDYVKTGKIKGFSIDAFLTLKEIKLNNNNKQMEKQDFKDALTQFKSEIKEFLLGKDEPKQEPKKVEVKLGSVKSQDGAIEVVFDGEALEVDQAVWVVNPEDESRVGLEAGEMPLDDGRVLVIGEDSLVAEVKDAQAEAPAEEELATEPTAPQLPNKATMDEIKSVLIKYSEENEVRFKALEDSLVEFKKENETLKEEVVTLSNQPASKPIKTIVKQKEYSEMNNYEKLKFNRGE